jgi:hypothetical protein
MIVFPETPMKIPSDGGGEGLRSLHRSAGVGWFLSKNPPEVPPCPILSKGGHYFH